MDGELSPAMQKAVEITKNALDQNDSVLLWSVDVARCLQDAGMDLPSFELGNTMVACVYSSGPVSSLWNYLDQAIASHLVSSFHILGLLTSRILPNRFLHPEQYSLYLELAGTYIFSLGSTKIIPCRDKVIKAVDEALQLQLPLLSGMAVSDVGSAVVHFIFTMAWRLVDASLEDWGMTVVRSDTREKVLQNQTSLDTAMEAEEDMKEKRREDRERIRKANSIAAIDLVSKIMQNKKTGSLLRLARRNLSAQWSMFVCSLQSLEALMHDPASTAAKGVPEALPRLCVSMQQSLSQEWRPNLHPVVRVLVETNSCSRFFGNGYEIGRASAWLPLDFLMEAVIEGKQVLTISVVDTLAELLKSLQAIQDASWHDAFLALWMSALRLVQRGREHMEGPRHRSESRLCMLLSIVPLASQLVIEEEESQSKSGTLAPDNGSVAASDHKECQLYENRRAAFASSLQVLVQFEGLLSVHQYVAAAANRAAATAAACVARFNNGRIAIEESSASDGSSVIRTADLRHLIVETCIARGLIDTSAYFWPGYLGTLTGSLPLPASSQTSPWNAYMDGASLNGSLKNSLMTTPAGSLTDIERIYQAAISGPEDERAAAASILCGASLIRGWNVQEHAVRLAVCLLSPSPLSDTRGSSHYLVPYASMLQAALTAISSDEALNILSLYGMFPELAATLLPICEVFGSLSPSVPLITGSGEDIPVLALFSLAFLTLLKLWKFCLSPAQHWLLGMGSPLGCNLNLDDLIMQHNMQVPSVIGGSVEKMGKDDQNFAGRMQSISNSFSQASKGPVVQTSSRSVRMDSFPKLRAWYLQHQACIASPLSGLGCSDLVQQVVDRLLNMMMRKNNKTGSATATPGTLVNSSGGDDGGGKPMLPAWDLLAAVPFVVDALLTACSHGKVSPRDLTTGLKDLVDFFPASIGGIVSYLQAEVTRGLWKPALMNGKDWPNPSASLLMSMEAEIRDMLAATGVSVPSSATGSSAGSAPISLPLPLAALVSLTITFKVDKIMDLASSVAGAALTSVGGCSPWPSMPAVAALWAQKVKRWHDFIVFASSPSMVNQDKNAVVQLLRSCFSVTLSRTSNSVSRLTGHGGVGALLGHGNWMHAGPGGRLSVPPGILYVRVLSFLHDVMFVPAEILMLLVNSVRESGMTGNEATTCGAGLKSGSRLRCLNASLATTVARMDQAATLAATLLFVSGGTTLAQLLYTETLPTWFLSSHNSREGSVGSRSGNTVLLEGYAMAYFAILSGVFAWGVSESKENSSSSSQRRRAVGAHLQFLATALDGGMSLTCDPSTWKAYAIGFVSMVVAFTPSWILDVKVDTLKRIAVGLRMWHELDLAVALIERGGPSAVSVAGELLLSY